MTAFIVRPFGEKSGIDFDRVERELIDPALDELGISSRTTAEIVRAGNIRTDMFEKLLLADLVVADISIHNANVFYELGVRHALRDQSTFLIRSQADEVPFDLKTDRYLAYDKDSPERSLPELIAGLRATLKSTFSDSPVYQLLPELKPPARDRFIVVPSSFGAEVERAAESNELGKLATLAEECRGFPWETEGLRSIGRRLFELESWRPARTTWERIRQLAPQDVEADHRLGTIWQRMYLFTGKIEDLSASNQALQRALDKPDLPSQDHSECHALMGRNLKTMWYQEWTGEQGVDLNRALQSVHLQEAFESYHRGFVNDLNHYFSGLNALALLTIRLKLTETNPQGWEVMFDDPEEARSEKFKLEKKRARLAASVKLSVESAIERHRPCDKADSWALLSLAEVDLLTDTQVDGVRLRYQQGLAEVSPFGRDSARSQLQIYRDLGVQSEQVGAVLALPILQEPATEAFATKRHAIVFTGHRVDSPDRAVPRFPAAMEATARDAIRKSVEQQLSLLEGEVIGIAGAASGGDILFHEILAELGIPSITCLALPPPEYVSESVASSEGNWVERFNQVRRTTEVKILAESKSLPPWLEEKAAEGYNIWGRTNLWMLGTGMAEGPAGLTLIALWNGEPGDGQGGTLDMIDRARELDTHVIHLDARAMLENLERD